MIKFENTEVMGWEAAIRGMRNPMNSWEKGDSRFAETVLADPTDAYGPEYVRKCLNIGPNDLDLMRRLAKGGPVHAKYRRMIVVYVDITAPLYWWKEFDTYKVGTVANSCSTMHKITAKEFTLGDFSCEHLMDLNDILNDDSDFAAISVDGYECHYSPKYFIQMTCNLLNHYRKKYLEIGIEIKNCHFNKLEKRKELVALQKKYWWQMIQLLPSSYNQKRTVMLNYEVLAGIYQSRRNHKLDEWKETCSDTLEGLKPGFGFCDWIKTLPYSELITGEPEKKKEDISTDNLLKLLDPAKRTRETREAIKKILSAVEINNEFFEALNAIGDELINDAGSQN